MNERMMKAVYESLKSGQAIRTLKTTSCLLEARTVFSEIVKSGHGSAISSQVASFFKMKGFIVVKDGVGFKISKK